MICSSPICRVSKYELFFQSSNMTAEEMTDLCKSIQEEMAATFGVPVDQVRDMIHYTVVHLRTHTYARFQRWLPARKDMLSCAV